MKGSSLGRLMRPEVVPFFKGLVRWRLVLVGVLSACARSAPASCTSVHLRARSACV